MIFASCRSQQAKRRSDRFVVCQGILISTTQFTISLTFQFRFLWNILHDVKRLSLDDATDASILIGNVFILISFWGWCILKTLLDQKFFSTWKTWVSGNWFSFPIYSHLTTKKMGTVISGPAEIGPPRWMLGVLIFEFMTGSAPFEAPYPMQIYAKVLNLGEKGGNGVTPQVGFDTKKGRRL